MSMEHLAIWFEDTTVTPARVAPRAPARGLPVDALKAWVDQVPEAQVFAYRQIEPARLSAVCMAVPTLDEVAPSCSEQLLQLARDHGTIAWIRPYHEASYKAGWDAGTPLFPEEATPGPTKVGALPGPGRPGQAITVGRTPHLALMLATLDELLSPSTASFSSAPVTVDESTRQRVVAQVVAHTAAEGNMVPWPQAEAALQQVLSRTAQSPAPVIEASVARRHFELRTIHEGMGRMDMIAGGTVLTAALAFGLPAGLLMGTGWVAWRKWVDWQAERSPRVRQRLLKAVGYTDPLPMDASPFWPRLPSERPAVLDSPRRVDQWICDQAAHTDLRAWMHAWWPLHDALVNAQRRPPLSLDHPGRWITVGHSALMADLNDALQRPMSPELRRAAQRYRITMAPWLAQEETLMAQWVQVLTAMSQDAS